MQIYSFIINNNKNNERTSINRPQLLDALLNYFINTKPPAKWVIKVILIKKTDFLLNNNNLVINKCNEKETAGRVYDSKTWYKLYNVT